MYPYSDLHTDLRDYAVGVALFDSYRLVDTKTNLVHSYSACSESDVPVCSEDLCSVSYTHLTLPTICSV